jgi:hypothetical protein
MVPVFGVKIANRRGVIYDPAGYHAGSNFHIQDRGVELMAEITERFADKVTNICMEICGYDTHMLKTRFKYVG